MGRDNALADPFSNFAIDRTRRSKAHPGELFQELPDEDDREGDLRGGRRGREAEKKHARHIPDPQATFGENRESRVVNFSWHMH